LLAAFKRMANILGQNAQQSTAETATSGPPTGGAEAAQKVNPALFASEEEKALFSFAGKLHTLVDKPGRDYRAIFAEFAAGKTTVDTFFDKVMVNHEDQKIRANRLTLLQHTLAAVKNLIALEELT
jgi:glycyl-tRNA synthetase beta chain